MSFLPPENTPLRWHQWLRVPWRFVRFKFVHGDSWREAWKAARWAVWFLGRKA